MMPIHEMCGRTSTESEIMQQQRKLLRTLGNLNAQRVRCAGAFVHPFVSREVHSSTEESSFFLLETPLPQRRLFLGLMSQSPIRGLVACLWGK